MDSLLFGLVLVFLKKFEEIALCQYQCLTSLYVDHGHLYQEGVQPLVVLPDGLTFAALQWGRGVGVNAELAGELVLANPQDPPHLNNPFPKAAASIGERRVPKELNDLWDKVKPW